jgi:NADH:ubiquinone oxidoreductase subunit 6 (subunit J)
MKLSTLLMLLSSGLLTAVLLMLLGTEPLQLIGAGIVTVAAAVLFVIVRMVEKCAHSH